MDIRRFIVVLITAWVGSLWAVCGFVAPTLFGVIEDRATAGQVAAVFFRRESWIGLGLGALVAALGRPGRSATLSGRGFIFLGGTALLPVCSEIFLSPLMQHAREAGDRARFGILHGTAGALFVVACLTGLGLVLEFSRAR